MTDVAASLCQVSFIWCDVYHQAAAFCSREKAESALDLFPGRHREAVQLLAQEFLETWETWEDGHVTGKSTMACRLLDLPLPLHRDDAPCNRQVAQRQNNSIIRM